MTEYGGLIWTLIYIWPVFRIRLDIHSLVKIHQ